MTSTSPTAGRATAGGRTARRRGRLPVSRLGAVVLGAALAGLTAGLAASCLLPLVGASSPVLTLGWLPAPVLVPVLVAVTCAADLVAVRLRYGDHVEELALIEAAVVMSVLLLPPGGALLVTLAGKLAAEVLRRRQAVKALFNLGTFAASTAVLVTAVRLLGGSAEAFTPGLVVGLVVGTAGFALVNLVFLSGIFAVVRGSRPLDYIRAEARLSVLMAVGTTALGSTVLAMALHAPALLPFSVLPAAALMYSYGAVLQEAEERSRSQQLLSFSHAMAETPDRTAAVGAFLDAARGAFPVDQAFVLLADRAVFAVGEDSDRGAQVGAQQRALTPDLEVLRDLPAGGALALDHGLPRGWRDALLAPLEAEGRRLGTVVLGSHRKGAFATRDRTLLTPIVNALAVALVNAEHLASVIAETGKLQAVVDKSSDGIVVLDGEGVVELWSPAAARLVGRSEAEALGAPLASVLDAREPDGGVVDAFARGRDRLTPASPTASVELPVLRPDGESRIVRCAYAAIFDGDTPVRYVVLVHDLTRERQVDRLKADFIATVSHELRTPVTPIKGYADLLRRRGDEMTPEKRAQCLDTIVDRSAHLARLVEDLLLASRMSDDDEPTRRVEIGSADLAALVRRATEDFRVGAGRLRLDAPDGPVTVSCDPTRTVQVLTNLVGNALKYSPADVPVDVVVDTAGTRARVTVTDRGRGLPEDQLERIFEKFHRVEDPAVMTTSGTGLGLFIARSLARAMGGDITVRSTLGRGSTFTFVLPCETEAPAAPPVRPGSSRSPGRPGSPPPGPEGPDGADVHPVRPAVRAS